MRIVYLFLLCCLSLALRAQVLESDDQIRNYFEKSEAKKSLSKKEIVDHLWKQNLLVRVKVNFAGNMMISNDSLDLSELVLLGELDKKFASFVDFMNLYPHETIVYLFMEHETLKSDTTAEVIDKCVQIIKEHNSLRQKQIEKYFSQTEVQKSVVIIKPVSSYYAAIVDSLQSSQILPSPDLSVSSILRNITEKLKDEPQVKVERKMRLKYSGSRNNTKEYFVFHVDSMIGYPDHTEVFITHFTPNESVGVSRNCILKNTVTGKLIKIKNVRGDVGFENKKVIPGSRLRYVLIFPPVQSDWKQMELTGFLEENINIKFEGEWLTDEY